MRFSDDWTFKIHREYRLVIIDNQKKKTATHLLLAGLLCYSATP